MWRERGTGSRTLFVAESDNPKTEYSVDEWLPIVMRWLFGCANRVLFNAKNPSGGSKSAPKARCVAGGAWYSLYNKSDVRFGGNGISSLGLSVFGNLGQRADSLSGYFCNRKRRGLPANSAGEASRRTGSAPAHGTDQPKPLNYHTMTSNLRNNVLLAGCWACWSTISARPRATRSSSSRARCSRGFPPAQRRHVRPLPCRSGTVDLRRSVAAAGLCSTAGNALSCIPGFFVHSAGHIFGRPQKSCYL